MWCLARPPLPKFVSLPIAVVLFALALVSSLPGLELRRMRSRASYAFDVGLARPSFGSMGCEVFNVRMRKKLGKG